MDALVPHAEIQQLADAPPSQVQRHHLRRGHHIDRVRHADDLVARGIKRRGQIRQNVFVGSDGGPENGMRLLEGVYRQIRAAGRRREDVKTVPVGG